MILDDRERFVISVGWKKDGGLLRRDVRSGELTSFDTDVAGYFRLYCIDADRFLAVNRCSEHDLLALSVRRFEAPPEKLWSLAVTLTNVTVDGDWGAAVGIPRHYSASFANGGKWNHRLVTIDLGSKRARLGTLPWYTADAFDMGDQLPIDAASVPGSDLALISVRKASLIVLQDPEKDLEITRVKLPGVGGNAMLTLVGSEVWTINYDTFVRIDIESMRVLGSLRVQPPPPGTPTGHEDFVRQFAGDLFPWRQKNLIAIPRPYSNDVVIADPFARRITQSLKLDGQPMMCVVTKLGHVIARDWKTGNWLEGDV